MNPSIKSLLLLFVSCVLLAACDDDDGSPNIRIDTPTTEASFSTTASGLMIGGTVSFAFEVYATNLRTGKRYRYESDLGHKSENIRWQVFIPDLQSGENEIVATALSANDFRETRIAVIRTP